MNLSLPRPRRPLPALALLLGTGVLGSTALAQCPEEPPLQHWTGGGQVLCPCFVTGEEAGATFEAPAAHYPIEILRVGIGWGTQFGGGPQSLEQAVHLYAGGLPNPGVPQFSLPAPVLSDGFINEFDIELIPGNKTIPSGPFTVTLEFANSNAGQLFDPSMTHDGNGCQGGKNVVYAIPGGWSDACALGVTGDWQVHVVYRSLNCGGGLGTVYCLPAAPNSTGGPAHIEATGSDAVVDDDVTLTASDLPPNQFGYFLTSQSQALIANPGGSQGNLCLTGNIGRYVSNVMNSGPNGTFQLAIDLTSMPTNPVQGVFAGQTWNFQAWYRDVNPTPTSNFTDAVSIAFQ